MIKKISISILLFVILAFAGVGLDAFAKSKLEVKNKDIACVDDTKTCHLLQTKALALNNAMRALWEQHVLWTRLFIVENVADLDSAGATAERLLKNQEDIGNAIKPFYGDAAGMELTALLKTHISGAVAILDAAKIGDDEALESAVTAWYANAHDIAVFLSSANPNWPLDEMDAHMKEHLDLTLTEATNQLQGNYSESIADFDKIEIQILHLADTLTSGIIAQFPGEF